MTRYECFRMAAIQAAPVLFDQEASARKACQLIREAGAMGAAIAAFGEAWLPGYPFFVYAAHGPLTWKAIAEYVGSAVEIPSPTTDLLCEAAHTAGLDVAIGILERDRKCRGTVYCTLLFISKEGQILGRHRKLKPTYAERTVWSDGDAVGLRTYERSYGRISGLNCWEHNMALPAYALAAQGTQIHVAAWPGRELQDAPPAPVPMWTRQLLMSRAFASQAACYVIGTAGLRLDRHVPERYKELACFEHTGDSIIIDPRGEVIAGPVRGETILVAEGCLEMVHAAKAAIDIAGHYSRPDIFQVYVNREPVEHLHVREAPRGEQPDAARHQGTSTDVTS